MEIAIDVTPILNLGVDMVAAAQAIETESKIAMMRSVIPIERSAKQEVPRYTGHLFRTITYKVTAMVGGIEGQVGTNDPKAADVERGSPPRTVPFDVLAKWAAKQIGGDPKDPGFRAMVAEIQKRIAARGTQPHPYLIPALEQNREAIDREFALVIPRALKRLGSS